MINVEEDIKRELRNRIKLETEKAEQAQDMIKQSRALLQTLEGGMMVACNKTIGLANGNAEECLMKKGHKGPCHSSAWLKEQELI